MFNWIGAIGSNWWWLYPLVGFVGGSVAYTFVEVEEEAKIFGFTFFLWPLWILYFALYFGGHTIYFVCSKWFLLLKWIKNQISPSKAVVTVSKTIKSKPSMPEGTDKASRLQALD